MLPNPLKVHDLQPSLTFSGRFRDRQGDWDDLDRDWWRLHGRGRRQGHRLPPQHCSRPQADEAGLNWMNQFKPDLSISDQLTTSIFEKKLPPNFERKNNQEMIKFIILLKQFLMTNFYFYQSLLPNYNILIISKWVLKRSCSCQNLKKFFFLQMVEI